jgi:hypothetical protein
MEFEKQVLRVLPYHYNLIKQNIKNMTLRKTIKKEDPKNANQTPAVAIDGGELCHFQFYLGIFAISKFSIMNVY